MDLTWLPVWTALIGAGAALVGAAVGATVTLRSARIARGHQFLREQLTEFYAPMAALRTRIDVLSKFRVKVDSATDDSWRQSVSRTGNVPAEFRAEHLAVIGEHNRQFREDLIPLYQEMVRLFTQKFHLADPQTRAHYATLLEFTEGWRRHFDNTMPGEVIQSVMPSEQELHHFYDDLLSTTDRLREAVRSGTHR